MLLAEMDFILGSSSPISFFDLLIVQSILTLISVPISAIILRQAIYMFNEANLKADQTIQMPSLLKAMRVSLIATVIIQVLVNIVQFALDPQCTLFLSTEKNTTILIATIVSSLIVAFFAYSGVLSCLFSISFNTAMRVVLNDSIVRFVILLVLDCIAYVLYGIGLFDGQILFAANFWILGSLLDILGPGLFLCLAVKLFNTLAGKEVVSKPPFLQAVGVMFLLHVISALVVWGTVSTIIPWDSLQPDVRQQSNQFYLTVLLVVSALFWVWSLILAKTLQTNVLCAMGVMFCYVMLGVVAAVFVLLLLVLIVSEFS